MQFQQNLANHFGWHLVNIIKQLEFGNFSTFKDLMHTGNDLG
jgi:hypothetical protein